MGWRKNSIPTTGRDHQRRFVRGEWGNPEGRIFTVDPLSYLEPTPELLQKTKDALLGAVERGEVPGPQDARVRPDPVPAFHVLDGHECVRGRGVSLRRLVRHFRAG